MQETTNYKLKKPEGTDPVNVADFNENADVIDLELSKRVESAGGDISDTKIGAADTAAQEFPVPAPGDTARGFLGKMRKFCSDFNSFKTGVITLGKLVNNGLTTEEGYALDARYGKTLLDMVTRLNSDLGGLNSNFEAGSSNNALSDLDNATMAIQSFLGTAAHAPNSWGAAGKVITVYDGLATGVQLAITKGYPRPQYRTRDGASWGAWTDIVTNTDIIVKEFRKTGISVTANTITGINMGDVIQVPSGYRLAAVTPTLSGTRATGMLVSCNQRNYTFFPIYSIAESSDIILDVNCIFIRQ